MSQKGKLKALNDLHVFESDQSPLSEGFLTEKILTLPHEIGYLVNCSNAEILVVKGGRSRLCEKYLPTFTAVDGIVDQLVNEHADLFLDFNIRAIGALLRMGNIKDSLNDCSTMLFKTKSGRMLMRRGFPVAVDENRMLYSGGIITDVTELYNASGFSYLFQGPNEKLFYQAVNELNEFEDLLSKRELMVLKHVGSGLTAKEIAAKLYVRKHTIDKHRKNILRKLEVSNSIQAYNRALELGILRNL